MDTDNSTNMSSRRRSEVLAWPSTERGADASNHVSRIRAIAETVMFLDAYGRTSELSDGTICALMCMLENELSVLERILSGSADKEARHE